MALTTDEIVEYISLRWQEKNLGTYANGLGTYTVKLQKYYDNIYNEYFENLGFVSWNMLWVFAYVWVILRFETDLGDDETGKSPMPKPSDMDDYPLDVAGIVWDDLLKEEYVMMVDSYIHDLRHAWQGDTITLWSDESEEAARHLFQTCKQYLLRFGVGE
jgi:hypothetical protein